MEAPLWDLQHLSGRRRYCDRTSVSFTHLLWEKPGGFRWFVSKEQEPRGASGFLLGEDETWRLRDIFPRIVRNDVLLRLCYRFPHIYHFPVCKKDLSATLEMTVRENARLTFVFNPSRRRWQRRMPRPRIVIPTEVEGSLLHNAYQYACGDREMTSC